MKPIATKTFGDVTVAQFEPDWDDLAWCTMVLLGTEYYDSPGLPEAIVDRFYATMVGANALGTRYINPRFLVTGPGPTGEFIRAARRAQLTWLKDVKTVFGRAGLAKWERNRLDPVTRQLCFTGVMIVEGKYLAPHTWWRQYSHLVESRRSNRKRKRNSKPRDLTGHRFGKLTVLARRGHGSWLCRCDCGREKTVKQCHFVSGRTKSCGCLKQAVEHRQHARKGARELHYNGLLCQPT